MRCRLGNLCQVRGGRGAAGTLGVEGKVWGMTLPSDWPRKSSKGVIQEVAVWVFPVAKRGLEDR